MKMGFRCNECGHIYPLSPKGLPIHCVACGLALAVTRVKRKWFKWTEYTEEDEYKDMGLSKKQLMMIDKLFLEKCMEVNQLRRRIAELEDDGK